DKCLVQVAAGTTDPHINPFAPFVLVRPFAQQWDGRRLVGRQRLTKGHQTSTEQEKGHQQQNSPGLHFMLLVDGRLGWINDLMCRKLSKWEQPYAAERAIAMWPGPI